MRAMSVFRAEVLILIGVMCPSLLWATPAKNMQLQYDIATKELTIQADHVSDRLEKHYIRKLVIKLNGEEVETKYFPRQQSPAGFSYRAALDAKMKDMISVELFCSQGGQANGEYVIPEKVDNPNP